jgi:hypothetical protein
VTRRKARPRPEVRSAPAGDPILRDPGFIEWAEHQRIHVMPMIQESGVTISLVPKGPADMKFAVELGLSIMLDKPIIAVIEPGQEIPGKLIAVADHIVEWEPGQGQEALTKALGAVMGRDDL